MYTVKRQIYTISEKVSQIYYYTLNDDDILKTFHTFQTNGTGFYFIDVEGIQISADNTKYFNI